MRAVLVLFALALALPARAETPPPGATSCTGCHGSVGLDLSALSAEAIEEALAGFRSGAREATLMGRIAAGFTPEESAAIASWLAGD